MSVFVGEPVRLRLAHAEHLGDLPIRIPGGAKLLGPQSHVDRIRWLGPRIAPALVSGPSDDPEAVPGLASANARLSESDQKLGNAFSISLP